MARTLFISRSRQSRGGKKDKDESSVGSSDVVTKEGNIQEEKKWKGAFRKQHENTSTDTHVLSRDDNSRASRSRDSTGLRDSSARLHRPRLEEAREKSVVGKVVTKISRTSEAEERNAKVLYEEFGEEAKYLLKVRTECRIPEPNEVTDVVVRVKASTVSYKDCIIRRGLCAWKDTINLPITPGFECVGVIDKVGEEVLGFKAGDTVAALIRTGGNAKFTSVPASSLVKVDGNLDSSQAVCLVHNYMTAYQVLYRSWPDGQTQGAFRDKTVLVVGGSDPVGIAIIELAHAEGATVYATAKYKHHSLLRGIGAIPLPFEPAMWLPLVRGKIDLAIDGVCQDNFLSPKAALHEYGYLVCIGTNSILINNGEGEGWFGKQASARFANLKATLWSRTQTYDVWSSFQENPEEFKHDMECLCTLLKRNKIKPRISKRIRLDQVAFYHHLLEQDNAKGTIVVKPWKKA